MASVWKRIAAMGVGTSLASIVGVLGLSTQGFDAARFLRLARLEQIRERAERHRDRVLASAVAGDPADWCGSYSYSNGFEGHRLVLAPEGFFFAASGCMGTRELAFGTIETVEGLHIRVRIAAHVIVDDAIPSRGGRRDFFLTEELYSIPWGDERFLVPAELMSEFCALATAEGWDSMEYADYPARIPSTDGPYRRSSPLAGLPDVPSEFRAYLPR